MSSNVKRDRQHDARRAFGDREKSIEVHGAKMETFNVDIRKNGAMRNRAMVLSSLVGVCTAASVAAIAFSSPQVLPSSYLHPQSISRAVVAVVAGGLSIAFATTSSFAFEREIYDLELRREMWEIENHYAGELQEMITIYKGQGLSEEEALIVTRIFSKQKLMFANLMMVEELGYSRLEPPTAGEALTNAGLPAALGFVIGLATPTLPLLGILHLFHGQTNDSLATEKKVQICCASVFAMCSCILSYAQTEVFFGAYADFPVFIRTVLSNTAGIGCIYGLSYFSNYRTV